MSLLLVNKVKPLPLPFGPKSILHWLADESRDGENVQFGIEYLAKLAGCSERTAQNHIRYLEEKAILIPVTRIVGRGKYPTYKINLDVIIAPPVKGKPRGGLRKPPPLVPTNEEPRLPANIRSGPPVADVAPAAAADQDFTIDIEELRERRARILILIEKARAGDKDALWWWDHQGARALDTLATINQIIGLDAEIEQGVTI